MSPVYVGEVDASVFGKSSAPATIAAAATAAPKIPPRIGGVRAARGVSGDGAGPQLIDQVRSLCLLAQLEVCGLKLVSQRVQLILRVHIHDALRILVIGLDHIAETAFDQSLSIAATLLILESGLSNVVVRVVEPRAKGVVNAMETVEQGCVHGIKAITQAVLDAANRVFKALEVHVLAKVGPGQGAAAIAAAKTSKSAVTPAE